MWPKAGNEKKIGTLTAQFQCLRRLKVHPERACDITVICAISHNESGVLHPAVQMNESEDVLDGRDV